MPLTSGTYVAVGSFDGVRNPFVLWYVDETARAVDISIYGNTDNKIWYRVNTSVTRLTPEAHDTTAIIADIIELVNEYYRVPSGWSLRPNGSEEQETQPYARLTLFEA